MYLFQDPDENLYDIALLKVDSPIDFKPNIIPICLPRPHESFVGETGYATGWGRTYEEDKSGDVKTLREVHLPILSNNQCESMLLFQYGYRILNIRNRICAGTTRGGKDTCQGDSGGPLVVKSNDGRYTLAGITSGGKGCGRSNTPGLYTNVSKFTSFIIRNTDY